MACLVSSAKFATHWSLCMVLLRIVATANSEPSGDCVAGGPAVPEDTHRFANSSIAIAAPAHTIWALLVNMSGWSAWNDVFVARNTSSLRGSSGKTFWIDSYFQTAPLLFRRTSILMKITELVENEKVCWNPQGLPGLEGTHCYVLCPIADGTLVYNYEDHKGFLAGIVRRTMANATTDGFNRFNANLSAKALLRS